MIQMFKTCLFKAYAMNATVWVLYYANAMHTIHLEHVCVSTSLYFCRVLASRVSQASTVALLLSRLGSRSCRSAGGSVARLDNWAAQSRQEDLVHKHNRWKKKKKNSILLYVEEPSEYEKSGILI